jgi:GAF domain-containing protein
LSFGGTGLRFSRVTEQIFAASVDDLLPGHQQEIARLEMLVEAAGRLLGTLDLDAVLPEVLELARATLEADAYALWRRDGADWSLQASAGLSDAYVAAAPDAVRSQERDFPLDEPLVASDVASTEWLTAEHRAAHAAEGTHAFLAVPLRHRDEVIGTLVFYSRRPRTFAEPELRVATSLASVAAAAIGTAEVYVEQTRLAESRRLLAEASEQLASSLDYETTLANVAALVVPTFADWCIIDIVAEDGSIQRVAAAHEDPTMVERANALLERVPIDPDAPRGIPQVIRTQRARVTSEITD